MPKVGRVGKFRKTAAASKAAVATAMEVQKDDGKKQKKMEITDNSNNNKRNLRKAASKNPKPAEEIQPTLFATDSKPIKETEETNAMLSRGQRRRQAKREQYLRKEKMILSTLQLKKAEDQRKRIDGLDALKEALLETVKDNSGGDGGKSDHSKKKEDSASSATTITTNKAKQRLVGSEINHMSLVLQHPAFKEDPFQAIQAHLKNTLEAQGKANEKEAIQHNFDRQQAKEQRKADKKERLKSAKKKKSKHKFKATRSRGKS